MKKIFVMFILSLGVMGILAGCGKKDDGDEGSDKSTPTPEVTSEDDKKEDNEVDYEEDDDVDKGIGIGGEDMANFTPEENPVIKEDYDYNDYIKLGKYKGIEVKIDKMEVTDDYLDANIQIDLLSNAITPIEVTNRAVRHADTVNIDYVGYHKGEPFDGGADQGYDLTIGSKTFIEGFEEQLIGVEADGKEIDINVVFPKNYNNATLAGEPVVFKVKVNSIKYIEITDDLIKESMGFDNEEAYRESFREQIIASIADGATRQKENDVYTAVINGAEITIPDNLLEYYESDIKTLYTNSAAMYGTTLENFIMQSNSTMEEFEAYAQYYSNNMATRELILKAISTAEGIELTEEEFQSEVTQYAEQYGYESNEQFLEEADEEVLREDLLFYKVIEFLVAESIEI
jgi:trigger factor